MSSKPKTNYNVFMDVMSEELLALLLAENRCTNMCIWCSEMKGVGPGNTSCDLDCRKHTLEFLRAEYDEEHFQRGLRFAYIPEEEAEE